MLNPIGFCFGEIKTFVRNETALYPSLDLPDAALRGLNSMNSINLAGYFRHIDENCVLSLQNGDF